MIIKRGGNNIFGRKIAATTASLAIIGTALFTGIAIPTAIAAESAMSDPVPVARWYDTTGNAARYRIPAFTQAPNGDLLAIYDIRPSMDDLPANIGVVMRRSIDGGATWGPVQPIRHETGKTGYGDPSVLVDRETNRIFVFYAGTVNQGFGGAAAGNTAGDANTMQVTYSYSDDNGATWRHANITKEAKKANWSGIFAASGEGIQVRNEKYKGRLAQQYVVRVNGENKYATLYSDDHGQTWQFSEPYGDSGDENKIVELSDGTLMLNARTGGGMRKVAYSDDGGLNWRDFNTDGQQLDPASNGTITRIYPDAAPDDPKAKMLMLLNAEDTDIRRNVTAKVSCDDGQTWPGRLLIDPDESAYVTGSAIFNADGEATGKVGVLYERDGYTEIAYTTIDTKKMNLLCAPISTQHNGTESTINNRINVTAGQQVNLTLSITNQTGQDLPAGTLSITGYQNSEWNTTSSANTPEITAGTSKNVSIPLNVPDTLLGNKTLVATYTADGKTSQQYVFVNVTGDAGTPTAKILVEPYLDAVYNNKLGDTGYSPLGDSAVVWLRVTNTGNVPLSNIAVSSNSSFTNIASCKWGGPINPGVSQLCKGNLNSAQLRHVITQADLDAGTWNPRFTVSADSSAGQVTASSDRINLNLHDFQLNTSGNTSDSVKVYVPTGDFQSSSYLRMHEDQPVSWLLPNNHDLGLEMAKDNRTSAQLVVNSPRAGKLSAEVSANPYVKWEISYPEEINVTGIKQSGAKPTLTGDKTLDPLRLDSPTISANKNQAIWFVAKVAPNAPAGVITQNITLKLGDAVIGTYPVHTSVRDVQLIAHHQRPFILDLWWHPDAIADWYGDPLWSDAHFTHMKPYLQELADAQQDVVNIVVNDDPWQLENGAPQTKSHYKPAVEWTFDGTDYNFDFTVFDKLVQAHAEVGIDGPIHLFSMVNFRQRDRLTYKDTRTGQIVDQQVRVGDAQYNKAWGDFLNALTDHLHQKGWFDRTSLMFDEQSETVMNTVTRVLTEIAPEWKGKLAAAADAVNEVDLTPYSAVNYQILNNVPETLIQERKEAGKQTLLYTWAQPLKPNLITPSPLMSSRTIGWIVGKKNLDGFLRWTFNSWPEDVYSMPAFMYSQGDEYLVYPGGTKANPEPAPVSAMRWEAFQDGIDDAEIIRAARNTIDADQDTINRILAAVGDANADSVPAWTAMVNARSQLLNLIGEQENTTPKLTASADTSIVTPGNPLKVTVKLKAPLESSLDPVKVKPQVPENWQITPAEHTTGKILPNQTEKLEFWVANNYGSGTGTIKFTATAAGVPLETSLDLHAVADECVAAEVQDEHFGASSEETAQASATEGPVRFAFDGNPSTQWHSQYTGGSAPFEVWWKTDAAPNQSICTVTYQMRQSGTNGKASAADIYTSEDGQTWHKAVSVHPRSTTQVQSFDLPANTKGPWVKFSITQAASTVEGQVFGSAAEFGATKKVDAAIPIIVTDSVNPDGTVNQKYQIPDNGISYVVNGEAKDPGEYAAQPGDKISVAMNGLAEHGHTLPEDTAPDWEHIFLKPEVANDSLNVDLGAAIGAGVKVSIADNGGTATFALAEGAPKWLSLATDGTLSGTVPADAALGLLKIPFTVTNTVPPDAARPALAGTFTSSGVIKLNVIDPTAPEISISPEPAVSAEADQSESSSVPLEREQPSSTARMPNTGSHTTAGGLAALALVILGAALMAHRKMIVHRK